MKVVYHPKFTEVYTSDPAAAQGRIECIHEELKNQYEFVEPQPASDEDILLAHTRPHVERLRILPQVYAMALLAAGGAVKTIEIAMKGEPAFGLIRPPGHHASRGSSWGFCYFNNVALAIEHLRFDSTIKKAMIIDIDLHYGDGTAGIFSGTSNVTYFHPEGGKREAYVEEVKRFLDIAHEPFDVVAVSAGFDRHEQDWGGMLKTEDYQTIGRVIRKFAESQSNGRRFAVLEGGYNHSVLGKNVLSFLKGME
jgi:acetoin utilization deacetylase AcuC-like enzyme